MPHGPTEHPARPRAPLTHAALAGLALSMASGCGAPGSPSVPAGDDAAQADGATTGAPLGAPCRRDTDCLAGICLASSYGPPFCSRACDTPGEACPAGPDSATGQSLCVSYAGVGDDDGGVPAFVGPLTTFCVPRCEASQDTCAALNPSWETCAPPAWVGTPLYPSLGSVGVCMAPSFQGKDPVDPALCDWDKAVAPQLANEANLCRGYCAYLETCLELPPGAALPCCEWGCFHDMVRDGAVVDAWHDEVVCLLEEHSAWPRTGPQNACSEPPKRCCGGASASCPRDPTPPSAEGP